jgi:hypothetical protein
MNKIINYINYLKLLIRSWYDGSMNRPTNSWNRVFETTADYNFRIDNCGGIRIDGQDLNNICGWNVTDGGININYYNDPSTDEPEKITLEVEPYWVSFYMPDFFMKYARFCEKQGLITKEEDKELYELLHGRGEINLTYNNHVKRTNSRRPSSYSVTYVELCRKGQSDWPEFEDNDLEMAIDGLQDLEKDVMTIFLKVVNTFFLLHEEKFAKQYFMKDYYSFEKRFLKDLFEGSTRFWGTGGGIWIRSYKNPESVEYAKFPHMLNNTPFNFADGVYDKVDIVHLINEYQFR